MLSRSIGWWCYWILLYPCWFCLVDLSIIERRELKYPAIFLFLVLHQSLLHTFFSSAVSHMPFRVAKSSWWIHSFITIMSFFITDNCLCFEVSFIRYYYNNSCFLLIFACCIFFHPFPFNLHISLSLKWLFL